MSGAAFEGLLAQGDAIGQSYEAGRSGMEREIAKELLDMYVGVCHDNQYETELLFDQFDPDKFMRCAAFYQKVIGDRPYEPQTLVDTVLDSLAEYSTSYESRWMNCLIDALIQALYNRGHNNLVVDMVPFESCTTELAHLLTGTAERPLHVRYHLGNLRDDSRYFGSQHHFAAHRVSHCRLEFFGNDEGESVWAGYQARDSEITFHGNAQLGCQAEDCTFHVYSPKAIDDSAIRCEYYAHLAQDAGFATKAGQRLLLGLKMVENHLGGFWRRSNRLYVPDADGGWKRVVV